MSICIKIYYILLDNIINTNIISDKLLLIIPNKIIFINIYFMVE